MKCSGRSLRCGVVKVDEISGAHVPAPTDTRIRFGRLMRVEIGEALHVARSGPVSVEARRLRALGYEGERVPGAGDKETVLSLEQRSGRFHGVDQNTPGLERFRGCLRKQRQRQRRPQGWRQMNSQNSRRRWTRCSGGLPAITAELSAPNRDPGHPVRLDACLSQALVDAGLVGAEGATSLGAAAQ